MSWYNPLSWFSSEHPLVTRVRRDNAVQSVITETVGFLFALPREFITLRNVLYHAAKTDHEQQRVLQAFLTHGFAPSSDTMTIDPPMFPGKTLERKGHIYDIQRSSLAELEQLAKPLTDTLLHLRTDGLRLEHDERIVFSELLRSQYTAFRVDFIKKLTEFERDLRDEHVLDAKTLRQAFQEYAAQLSQKFNQLELLVNTIYRLEQNL